MDSQQRNKAREKFYKMAAEAGPPPSSMFAVESEGFELHMNRSEDDVAVVVARTMVGGLFGSSEERVERMAQKIRRLQTVDRNHQQNRKLRNGQR